MIKQLMIVSMVCLTVACGGGSGGSSSSSSGSVEDSADNTDSPDNNETIGENDDSSPPPANTTGKNILLIISDDQGLDASAQYSYSNDAPNTPTLDSLASSGIVYDNVWATPSCATTRATLLTGKYGINSSITSTPGTLPVDVETIQAYLAQYPETSHYESAVFGKWHLGGNDANHPASVGIDYYAGNLGNPGDYFSWELTVNGSQETSSEYHTTKITDLAIEWIGQQIQPWFAWLAYSAPHAPFHLPPQSLHNRNLSGTTQDINNNRRDYYLAAIEAMDTEIGRLLASLSDDERDNTLILFIGDNGTPQSVIDSLVFGNGHSKNSLYEGGIRVPMLASGAGITRSGEREDALISSTDFFATIAEAAGNTVPSIYDSVSFLDSFTNSSYIGRETIYSAYQSADLDGWAVRNSQYKLIETVADGQEMYDVAVDIGELNDLLPADASLELHRTALQQVVSDIETNTNSGSNGSDTPVDITDAIFSNQNANCAAYAESYTSSVSDIRNNVNFNGDLVISVSGAKCVFSTNAIPNHDFNDGDGFATDVAAQADVYEITATPSFATTTTALSLDYDNAIFLNGVKMDLLAAACFGVGDERTGCNNINQPWRYDPLHTANGFRVDSHNAHTQPDGTYHYHGAPNALFYADTNIESPVVGFAADGFPIYGFWFDDNGTVRKATSSYALKTGSRPSGTGEPGGVYDGTFRDDYEYVAGSGDLDECNGMTVNGTYAYYLTEEFPYAIACFKGEPDISFRK